VQQSLLAKLPGGGVAVRVPPNAQLAGLAAAYAALGAWAWLQGASEPYAAQQTDVAGLQLALAFGAGVYYLRDRKRLGLGRAFLYGAGGLILGAVLGNALEQWLRVDLVPIGGMGAPGVVVAEAGLLGVALAAAFLA
jgi:Protein CHAPERONE-LIKE PROTEIN OF POR1-like